ncbi:MAG: DUF2029 domain-containing protein [Candidatus Dormibacteraeota bacterium]|nr:DUF2029 domain-containing protein [Candidatus Dormibacteraeota bacterium]
MDSAVEASATSERPPFRPARGIHVVAPLAAALAVVPVAMSVHYTLDFGLAYQGGLEAWSTGHPERLLTWTATPFYALVMALVTRVTSVDAGAWIFLLVNVLVWGGLLLSVWSRLLPQAPSGWWWLTLALAAIFSPAISTIFWMQPNLVILALALGGVALIGQHNRSAGVLIGLSIALKPLLVLLPLALLFRRDFRSAGWWAIAAAALLTVIGFGFLESRAGIVSLAQPIDYIESFLAKGRGPIVACVPENYSPMALLCRLGVSTSTPVAIVLGAAVLATGWLLARRLAELPGARWELFAAACLLSPMLGPIGWATYQLLVAPLMLLLAYQFWAEGAPARLWAGLLVAYLMTELVWDPLESLARTPVQVVVFSYSLGQFAQYVILLTWVRWLSLRKRPA